MRTFSINVHYKVIKILVVRWLSKKANAHFHRQLQVMKGSRAVSWERQQSEYNLFSTSIEYYYAGGLISKV